MQSNEFDAALAMIDTARWQRAAAKLRALLVIKVIHRRYGVGVPIGSRVVAASMGASMRTTRRVLDELADDGVLMIVVPGAGSRGAIYEIDPSVSRWRVPWAIEIELVELRLARLSERLPDANTGLVRVPGRAQRPIARAPWRAPIDDCARPGARADSWLERAPGGRQTIDDARGAPNCSIEELASYSSSIYGEVCKAIVARTGQGVFGKLANELQATLAGVDDAEPYVDAVRRHPNPVAGPPVLVRDLATLVAPADDPPPAPAPARPTTPAEPPEWLLEQSARHIAEAAELAASFTPAPGTLAARTAARGQNGHTPKGGTP